jgi:large subunit ribosomal protein L10
MPSAEHLREKQAIIDEIRGKLERAKSAVVIDYIGINVEEANAMRNRLRESNVDYKVYKNTLARRALEGTGFEALGGALAGPSAFAFGFDDAVMPAKALSGIFRDYKKMEFKAGIIEGTFYDVEGLKTIASLPSRDELIARFMGSIQSPLSRLVRTFQAIADAGKDGAEAAPEPEAAAPEPEAATPEPEAATPEPGAAAAEEAAAPEPEAAVQEPEAAAPEPEPEAAAPEPEAAASEEKTE